MKKVKAATIVVIAVFFLSSLSSCVNVKGYQKAKINDAEMTLGNRKIQKSELSFQAYREGSAGANSGKSGGGCGCN